MSEEAEWAEWKDYYCVRRVSATSAHSYYSAPEGDVSVTEGYAIRGDPHVTFIPKAAFEAAYKPVDAMGFEGALAAMKAGHEVERAGVLGIVEGTRGEMHFTKEDLLASDWRIVS